MKETIVINIKDAPRGWQSNPDYVYVGRSAKNRQQCHSNSNLGNPFVIGRDGTREDVIKKFRTHALGRIAFDHEYLERVKALYGKTLVCFCAPKACHGDVLADLAARLNGEAS